MRKRTLFIGLGCMLLLQGVFAQQKVLFVVAGQSNAVGQGSADSSVKVLPGVAFEYRYMPDALVPLADPVGESALDFEHANTGSAWPSFAQRFYELSKKNVIIIPAARGGSSAHQKAELGKMGTWAPEGATPLLDKSVEKIKKAEAHEKQKISGIIWVQGERDANGIFDKKITGDDYYKALESVIRRFRSALGHKVPFYIIETGNQHGREPIGNNVVRAMQQKIARKISKVHIVYDQTKTFAEKNRMKDFVHYNQEALNDIGKATAEKIYSLGK